MGPLGRRTGRRIRAKTFSATEVAEAFLARIEETNPALNALVDIRPEEALAQAAAADAAVAAGGDLPPLLGVPVSTKINTSQRGYASSHGVPAWAAPSPRTTPSASPVCATPGRR